MSETKHSARVTLSQIAKRVGLSSAAVSMALRGHQRISAATRQRVLEEATRLGYVYDRGAAKLRTGQSDTVGIIISDIANGFFGELVAGVDQVIAETGMISFLFNTRDDVRRQESLLIRLREQGVDGMILCPAPGTDPALLERISAWGIPTVQMLRYISADQADYVSADYRTGVETLCEHLLALGHRRIAFLGGQPRSFGNQPAARRLSWCSAASRAGPGWCYPLPVHPAGWAGEYQNPARDAATRHRRYLLQRSDRLWGAGRAARCRAGAGAGLCGHRVR